MWNIKVFRARVKLANPHYVAYREAWLLSLELYLEGLGAAIGPDNFTQIQKLWGAVPYLQQLKYKKARDYLKESVPGLVDAIPASPKMKYVGFAALVGDLNTPDGKVKYPFRFYHKHELSWKSSNGNMASLKNVGTRENVQHRTNPNGRPFDTVYTSKIPMLFQQGATTNAGADNGKNEDDHSTGNPSLIVNQEGPLFVGSVIADQTYEYKTKDRDWTAIPGAQYEIEKGVRQSGGAMVFFFRKQNAVGTASFHFEVEYPIGPKPVWDKRDIPVYPFSAAVSTSPGAKLADYASRIISPGLTLQI